MWRSRGRPGPTAPGTPAAPQATSLTTHSSRTTGVEGAGGSGGRKRAWLRCPRAVAGPGWASRRRITTQHRRRRRCGGRRRVRRARAGFEIDHSEPLGSRVAISRAAGPDGAWNTSGAASNKLNREFRLRRRCGGRRGACRAWPGFETTRRAKLAARTASGRAGPAAAGDQARLQAPLEIRTPRSTPGSGRPGGRRGARAR